MAEVEAAERELSDASSGPSGRLRISLPRYSGLFEPAIGASMQAYPAFELDLDFSDAMVNLVSDGFDAAVRTGELADSSLMRRKLCTFRRLLVASPAYLARHGRPAAICRRVCACSSISWWRSCRTRRLAPACQASALPLPPENGRHRSGRARALPSPPACHPAV